MRKIYSLLTVCFLFGCAGVFAQQFTPINIAPAGDSKPEYLTAFNGKVYFAANDSVHGPQLWMSDGTVGGTQMVTTTAGGSDPSHLTVIGSQLFFVARDTVYGYELWVSDGSPGGTHIVKDINPGRRLSSPSYLTEFKGRLYFAATDTLHGTELWVSDGTAGGTQLVMDIYPGPDDSGPQGYARNYGSLTTQRFNVCGDKMYFSANNGHSGYEPYFTNDTTVSAVGDLIGGITGSYPGNMTLYNGNVIFEAMDSVLGKELWITDGTGPNTRLLKDINPGSAGSYPANYSGFIPYAGKLYFDAGGPEGEELWVTDGTSAGTHIVKDINPGVIGSFAAAYSCAEYNGLLYFSATDGVHGFGLWSSDGTAAGTNYIALATPGAISAPIFMINYNGQLLFKASTAPTIQNEQLYTSDGTAGGYAAGGPCDCYPVKPDHGLYTVLRV